MRSCYSIDIPLAGSEAGLLLGAFRINPLTPATSRFNLGSSVGLPRSAPSSATLGLEVGLYGMLFRQRLQIGDNVLPVFLVRHEVDHPRSLDEFAGPLEIFV